MKIDIDINDYICSPIITVNDEQIDVNDYEDLNIELDIDIDDIIDEIKDEELLNELEYRNLIPSNDEINSNNAEFSRFLCDILNVNYHTSNADIMKGVYKRLFNHG